MNVPTCGSGDHDLCRMRDCYCRCHLRDKAAAARALRQAADDLEAAGGDYYSAQTEAWLLARADALTEGETE